MPDRAFLQSFLDRYLERLEPALEGVRAQVTANPSRQSYDIRLSVLVNYHCSVDRRDLLSSREQTLRVLTHEIHGFSTRLSELVAPDRAGPPRVVTYRDERGDLMQASSSDGTAQRFDSSAFSRQVDASLRAFGGRVAETLFSSPSAPALSAAHVPPAIDSKPVPKSLWARLDEVA